MHTKRRKHKLVDSHPLQRRNRRILLRKRERPGQEPKPEELDRRHEETIRHEAGEALEIKRRRQVLRIPHLPNCRGLFLIEIMDLD